MDPVSLVAGALAAGVSTTVTGAVQDAYAGLRSALLRRLRRGSGSAEQAVRELEARAGDPASLSAVVSSVGVAADDRVVVAAQRVLQLADPAGAGLGKYVIDLREAKGVQVGDHPTMTINF